MNWECCGEIQDTRFCPHCGAQVPNLGQETIHTLVKYLTEQRDAARRRVEKAAGVTRRHAPYTKTWTRWTKLGRTWTIQAAKYDTWLRTVLSLVSSEK